MKRCLSVCFVAVLSFCAISLIAQTPAPAQSAAGGGEGLTPQQLAARAKAYKAPEIPFESVPDFIKLPVGMYLGESMSLGTGLGQVAGKVFRIGHLGSFNDLSLAGTLSGVEMGLELAGVPFKKGGVQAALNSLASSLAPATVST